MEFEDSPAIGVKLCCSSLFAEPNTVQRPQRYSTAEGRKGFHSSVYMKLWVGRGKQNLGKYGEHLPQKIFCVLSESAIFCNNPKDRRVKENIERMGIYSRLPIPNEGISLQSVYFSHFDVRKREKCFFLGSLPSKTTFSQKTGTGNMVFSTQAGKLCCQF